MKLNVIRGVSTLLLYVVPLSVVLILVSATARAAYGDIPQQLPDDYGQYGSSSTARYICDGTIPTNQFKCPPFGNGIVDDNDHHQYFTIANTNNLNNVKNGEKIGGYRETAVMLYTKERSLSQEFGITPVNRGIRTEGGVTDCSGTIRTALTKPGSNTPLPTINTDFSESPDTCNKIKRLNLRNVIDGSPSFDNVFSRLVLYDQNGNPHNTDIYYTYLTITLVGNTNSRQFSYRISSNDMRLGIARGNFVNVYPTALADRHTMSFKWAAPCNETGTASAYTDNLDGTKPSIQSQNPSPHIQRYVANNTYGAPLSIISRDSMNLTYPLRVGQSPVRHEALFNNISGGNGIGFTYPYDSANYYLDCPGYKWNLSPETNKNTQAGPYAVTPSTTWSAAVALAKTAFSQARFTEAVKNQTDVAVQSGSTHHKWGVQYKYIRGDTGQESSIFTKNTDYTGAVSANGRTVFTSNSQVPTNNTTSGIEFLFGARYKSSSPASASKRIPNPSDKYCERLINDSYNSNEGGVSNNPSNWDCVELNGPPVCVPWTIGSDPDKVYMSLEDGGGSSGDAWVGSRYGFRYQIQNNGPASSTNPDQIARWRIGSFGDSVGRAFQLLNNGDPNDPNSADRADRSVLGEENFYYNYTVGPGDAGQTWTDALVYQPISKDQNCGYGGATHQQFQVTVPYYYHTIPKTSGSVPSQVQQGATISVSGSIKNPSDDRDSELMPGDNENGGRGHTYTQNIGWQRVIFRANDIADVNGKFTANGMRQGSGPGVCEVLGGIGIGGYRDCSVRDSGNTTLQIETKDLGLSGITLGLEPVGTVVCVALGINDPTHSTSPSDWRIAQPKCTTIIKSPKVQFKYGDVAVGRERLGVSPTCTVNTTAKIQTTSAPNVSLLGISDTEKYQFGSWDEYGVFSSGSILSFGSSGAEAGTTDKAKRLSFGNTSSTYGNYPYGIKCLPNLMNGYSAENTIPTDTIYPNQYFTDPSRNTKSRFQRTGNINLTLEPTKTYQAILSLKGYSDCGNDVPNGPLTPAKVRFVVELVGGQKITSSDMEVSSCSESSRPTYQTTVQLGGDGWRGIKRVDLQFINNNHNAAWETNSSQMRDRNLFVESLKIQWVRNGSEEIATTPLMSAADSRVSRTHPDDYYSTAPGNIDSDALCRKTNTDGRWWIGGSAFPDGRVAVPSTLGDLGYLSGLCHGLHIDNLASSTDGRFDDSETPTPILGPSYDGFRGRNIILYAKDTDNNCANNNGGNININLDMDYKRDGYTKLSEIPRFTLMADCNIIINNTVKEVRASLIAGDAIMTCSSRARTQGECNSKLTVTGAIQAKRLLLWRTSGADLTNPTDARVPAETFVYGVDQMMAGYEYGLVNPLLKPSYQRDLPPRY